MSNKRKSLYTLIFFLLLISTLIIFIYVRKEIFLKQAKHLLEERLERSLSCQLSIEKIGAGLFYDELVLDNLEISLPQDYGLALNIKVKRAIVDYNLWRNIFILPITAKTKLIAQELNQGDIQLIRLISPCVNISYPDASLPEVVRPQKEMENSEHYLAQKNNIQKPQAKEIIFELEDGQISLGNGLTVLKNMQGKLLSKQNGVSLQGIKATFGDNLQQTLQINGEFSPEQLILTTNLTHLKINNFELLSNLSLTLNKQLDLQSKSPKISGSLKTYGSVFNNNPFPELDSSFEIQDQKLRLLTFTLGDNYNLRGIIELTPPFNTDLSINFYQAAPAELLAKFILPQGADTNLKSSEQLNFSGLINGLIKISGELSRPKVEGYLEAKDGYLGDISFLSAVINIKGTYPKISIVDSRICREEESFIMEGEIDFTNWEKQNLLDISFKPDKGMLWQGWDITRRRDNQVHLSKNVADDVRVTFDTYTENEAEDSLDTDKNELGLEYKIFGDKSLKLRLRKDEGILGVERRVKF